MEDVSRETPAILAQRARLTVPLEELHRARFEVTPTMTFLYISDNVGRWSEEPSTVFTNFVLRFDSSKDIGTPARVRVYNMNTGHCRTPFVDRESYYRTTLRSAEYFPYQRMNERKVRNGMLVCWLWWGPRPLADGEKPSEVLAYDEIGDVDVDVEVDDADATEVDGDESDSAAAAAAVPQPPEKRARPVMPKYTTDHINSRAPLDDSPENVKWATKTEQNKNRTLKPRAERKPYVPGMLPLGQSFASFHGHFRNGVWVPYTGLPMVISSCGTLIVRGGFIVVPSDNHGRPAISIRKDKVELGVLQWSAQNPLVPRPPAIGHKNDNPRQNDVNNVHGISAQQNAVERVRNKRARAADDFVASRKKMAESESESV